MEKHDSAETDDGYVQQHRLHDVMQYLCYALAVQKPEDPAMFTRNWLANLQAAMDANGTPDSCYGINLLALDGFKVGKPQHPAKQSLFPIAPDPTETTAARSPKKLSAFDPPDSVSTSLLRNRFSLDSNSEYPAEADPLGNLFHRIDALHAEDQVRLYEQMELFVQDAERKKLSIATAEGHDETADASPKGINEGSSILSMPYILVPPKDSELGGSEKIPLQSLVSFRELSRGGLTSTTDMISSSFIKLEKTKAELERLLSCVTASTIFALMEREAITFITELMRFMEYKKDTVIVKDISTAYVFHLIIEGSVEMKLCDKTITLGPKQYFGGSSNFWGNGEPDMTVTAISNVVTCSLSKEQYAHLLHVDVSARRQQFEPLIWKTAVGRALPPYNRRQLCEALELTKFSARDPLVSRGENPQFLYIILEGEATIIDEAKAPVQKISRGELVCDIEMLFNVPAVASIVAKTKIQAAKLNRRFFEVIFAPIEMHMKRALGSSACEYLRTHAPEAIKNEIAALMPPRVAKPAGKTSAEKKPPPADIHPKGEIMLRSELGKPLRFPLSETRDDSLCCVALREDGTVVFWGEGMSAVTGHESQNMLGRSIFPLISDSEEQTGLSNAIQAAVAHAGRWSDYLKTNPQRKIIKMKHCNGMTQSQLFVSIVPALVAQTKSRPESALLVGHEVKPKIATEVSFSEWLMHRLTPQVAQLETALSQTIASLNLPPSETAVCFKRLRQTKRLIEQYNSPSSVLVAESWQAISIESFVSQLVARLAEEVSDRNNQLYSEIDASVPSDEIFMDVQTTATVLQYLIRNANRLFEKISITVRVKVCDLTSTVKEQDIARNSENRTVTYTVIDTGNGAPKNVIDAINTRNSTVASAPGLFHCLELLAGVGGEMAMSLWTKDGTGGTSVSASLPLLATAVKAAAGKAHDSGKMFCERREKPVSFTTVVIETNLLVRNVLCNFLWGRKHAVLPAASWTDVQQFLQTGNCDILLADVDTAKYEAQSPFGSGEKVDPLTIFADYANKVTVILCSSKFDESSRAKEEQATANPFGHQQQKLLKLPKTFTAAQLSGVMKEAESRVKKKKAEAAKIQKMRSTFAKTTKVMPQKVRMLGKGAFGEVWEVVDTRTGGKMAMKQFRVSYENKEKLKELADEIDAMTPLQHENIIHYFSCDSESATSLNLFMELATGGTLHDKIVNAPGGSGLDLETLTVCLREVLNGLVYVHANGFVHCDLKPANVLLDNAGHCKIGDFGTAKRVRIGELIYTMRGTPRYMAPEVMNADPETKHGYDNSADIWSLGCVVLEMATGQPAFSHIQGSSTMGLIKYISELTEAPDLAPLFGKHPFIFEFVKDCLNPFPSKRPSAKMLRSKPLLASGDDNCLAVAAQLLKDEKAKVELRKSASRNESVHGTPGSGAPDATGFFDSDDENSQPVPAGSGSVAVPTSSMSRSEQQATVEAAAFFDSDDD